MIDAGLKSKLDTLVSDTKASLDKKQAQYFAVKGQFWQGLKTPAVIPMDGQKLPPDKSLKPARQQEDYAEFGLALPVSMEATVRVDVYSGPRGKGYIMTNLVQAGGMFYCKRSHVGPDKINELDWVEVPNPASAPGKGG